MSRVSDYTKLSSNQMVKLKEMMVEGEIPVTDIPLIKTENSAEGCAVTSLQESLWLLSNMEQDTDSYNLSSAFRMKWEVNLNQLEYAIQYTLKRHECLRSVFRPEGGELKRFECAMSDELLQIVDARGQSLKDIKQKLSMDSGKKFALDIGPLYQFTIYRLDKADYIFHMVIHHMIADGISLRIITSDIVNGYEGNVESDEQERPSFSDYAAWRREWLCPELLKNELGYWSGKLSGYNGTCMLQPDKILSGVAGCSGKSMSVSIGGEAFRNLKDYALRVKKTTFTVFLGALKSLIHRYTQLTDIVVGVPDAGRYIKETEQMAGAFVNTFLLRDTVTDETNVEAFLNQVENTFLNAKKNGIVPLELIAQELKLSQKSLRDGLFQIFFIFHNSIQEINMKSGSIETVEIESRTAKYYLTFEVFEHKDHFQIRLEYMDKVYERETIEQLMDSFVCVINALASGENLKICEIPLMSQEKRLMITKTWNDTGHRLEGEKNIYELVRQRCKDKLGNMALITEEKNYSYRELFENSERLAGVLQKKGLKQYDRVGIQMENSPWLVIAILSLLKLGVAYVPLDQSLPEKRVSYIRDHAGLTCILSLQKYEKDETRLSQRMNVDTLMESEGAASECRISKKLMGANTLAYIMYTSGSTGNPKGVQISHGNVINFLYGMEETLGFTQRDSIPFMTTYSFDISVLEIFLPLFTGGSMVLIPSDIRMDMKRLQKVLNRRKPTFMQATPAFWKVLMDSGFKPGERTCALTGGEAVDQETAECLNNNFERVFNMYGPTETTVWSSVHLLDGGSPVNTIGRPILNTKMYILDKFLYPVPPCVEGDLYIGGEGISCGYYNNCQETQQKFIDVPFDDYTGKLFFTGDRAKYRTNGEIMYTGRSDYMLKIRGYRMEAQEIEAKLDGCEALEKSIVLAKNDYRGERLLVAYVLKKEGFSDEQAEQAAREYLGEELPPYMIPSRFCFIKEFPMTYNLKIDRKNLMERELEEKRKIANACKKDILDSTTEEVKKIWCDVLKIQDVDNEEDFYDLGGHSLQAIRISYELEQRMGVSLPVNWIMKHTVFQDFCCLIREMGKSAELASQKPSVMQENESYSSGDPFPLTDVQRAYLLGRSSNNLGNVSTHIYREMEVINLDITELQKALNLVIRRHGMLRAIFREDGTQIILPEVPVYEIETSDYTECGQIECEEELEGLRKEMSHQLFNPKRWPLFELKVSKLPNQCCRIHFSFDCMVGDAKSMQIIFKDLSDAYGGKVFTPPLLEYDFRRFVLQQLEEEKSVRFQKAREYWRERVTLLPGIPQLTLTANPKQVEKPHFKRYKKVISREIWSRVCDGTRKSKLTKTAFMLTCFTEILKRWCQEPEFLINITLFNRPPVHSHIPYIVGDFTSVCLFAAKLFRDEPFVEIAKENQMTLLETLEHSSYNGIRLTKDLMAAGTLSGSIPVVFTSLLDESFEQEDNGFIFSNTEETSAHDITQTPQVWLDHQIFEYKGELNIVWDVVEELFDQHMISEMLEAYADFVIRFADESSWKDGQPAMSGEVTDSTGKSLPCNTETKDKSLLFEAFIRQAQACPKQIAIISEEMEISYDRLDQVSDRLALRLMESCGTEEKNVAIVMKKGWEEIAAILGILKAGKAYVPIQADLPGERIKRLLNNCDIKTVLVKQENICVDVWNEDILAVAVTHDEEYAPLSGEERKRLMECRKNLDPDAAAYMIYTSGSTGVPKAVVMSHSAAWNTISDINERFEVSENDRILCLSSICFDLSVYDIFGLLSAGGTLVIPASESAKSPSHWFQFIKQYGVTIWNSVPALMKMLMHFLEKTDLLQPLRLVLLSGDWVPVELPGQILEKNKEIRVVSLGGATECAIWSVLYEIEQVSKEWTSIPYGKAMKNQWIGVLNKQLAICPDGVEGDIYIAGAGLSLGYYKDAEKTEKSFIRHPVLGQRMYKTGDKGKYGEDGNVIFLGREDSQVKLNGYRIELGEIEAAIRQVPGIAQAVAVMDNKDESGKIRAYYVPDKENEEDEQKKFSKLQFKLQNHGIRKGLMSEKSYLLPKPISRQNLFHERRTYRKFSTEPMELYAFAEWLSVLGGKEYEGMPFAKRIYASAGGLYPIQTYIGLKKNAVKGLEEGYYYYNPVKNELQQLYGGAEPDSQLHVAANSGIYERAAFMVIFVTDMKAIEPIYGNQNAYMYSLLEAGMMTQLLELKGIETGLGFCQIGALHAQRLNDILQLEEGMHYLHCLLGGRLEEYQMTEDCMRTEAQEFSGAVSQNSGEKIKQIRTYLSKHLPEYMIPKEIIKMSSIPLTENGKIDYKLLEHAVEDRKPESHEKDNINWNTVENSIANIWKQILQTDIIGLDDNFFDIGGNSFNIILVQKELKKLLGQEIPVLELFRYTSVSALAGFIAQNDCSIRTPDEEPSMDRGTRRRNRRLGVTDRKVEERKVI